MDWLIATYRVRSPASEIEARCRALAVEQSIEMPLDAVRQPNVLSEVVAKVTAIRPSAGDECFDVQLSLSAATLDGSLAQLLNMAFGNCSLQPDVELVDLAIDPQMLADCPGPAFGIDGLRRLTAIPAGQALTCTALKPQGSTPAELAELAATFARAGVAVIKDDHGLANQAAAPFAARVAACQAAVTQANQATGGSTIYAPSLVGHPRAVAEGARIAREEGIAAVLVAPMIVGLSGFADLVAHELNGLAVLGHPALGGAARIAAPLLIGKLFRLAGADAVIFPSFGGRFGTPQADCAALADAARRPWGALAAALPVPAGGLTPDRVPELLGVYGNDVMLLIGGALLQAGDQLEEATRAFVEQVSRCSSSEVAP